MIKFVNYDIVFQEIPDKVSLALNISNCQNNCKGCHSSYLKKDIGTELTTSIIDDILLNNIGINCVLFMGEGNDIESLINLAKYIKTKNISVAIYSGLTECDKRYYSIFDYIKVGPYIKEFGPLNSSTTNQKLFQIQDSNIIDITYKMLRD